MTQSPTEFPNLLSPLKIGPKTIRNRVLISGHQPSMAEKGLPTPQYLAYQAARAKGGAGLQITGATGVHPTGTYESEGLHNIDDRIIPGYQQLAKAVQSHGGHILAQLAHGGATIPSHGAGRPLWAPSPVASELVQEVPHEMTAAEIDQVVKAFGAAAYRVRQGKLDGVEILGAFGLLIAAFLSPYANKRTDAYGGSLENRLRFCLNVVQAVRENAGPDLIVGIRIPGAEMVNGGLELAEMQEIAQILEATGHLDYFNVIAGTNLDRQQRAAHWPPTPSKHGLFVHLASDIKSVVNLPVFTVGRIVDPRHAEQILREGHADMVGMTRAHIADPDLVTKAREGRVDDIRPCVGANVCIRNAMNGHPITCIHNPEVGREGEWGPLTPATTAKRVVVVGGGPAGLEAARISALRGHRVELFEKEAALGGQLRLWGQMTGAAEYKKIVDWQIQQLQKLDVTVHLGESLTADMLQQRDADVIILATGARPQQDALPGQDKANIRVMSPHQLATETLSGVQRAMVWDQAGGQAALSATETLLGTGVVVEIVTPGFAVGDDVPLIIKIPFYKRLLSAGAVFTPNCNIIALDDTQVTLQNVYSQQTETRSDIDLIVAWSGNRVVDDLSEAVRQTGTEFYMIGDCVAPRAVDVAMAEAAEIARKI